MACRRHKQVRLPPCFLAAAACDSNMAPSVAKKQYRTIKDCRCRISGDEMREDWATRRITDVAGTSQHPGRHHVMQRLDGFRLKLLCPKPHRYLVMEPMRGTLDALKEQMAKEDGVGQGSRYFGLAKEVARQILQGLDFLHEECGIIHTGEQQPEPRVGGPDRCRPVDRLTRPKI